MFSCPKGAIQSVFCHPSFSCLLLLLQLLRRGSLLTLMVVGRDAEQRHFQGLIQSPVTLREGHGDKSSLVRLSQASLRPRNKAKRCRGTCITHILQAKFFTLLTFSTCRRSPVEPAFNVKLHLSAGLFWVDIAALKQNLALIINIFLYRGQQI